MDIDAIQQNIGVTFNDDQLLLTALTHRSYLNEHRKRSNTTAMEHNERLEFLGDAVLELVVTEHLYNNYSEPEGVLTNWRSAVVKTESLSEAAHELKLDGNMRLSRGEAQGSPRARQQITANAVEAIIGALYLDQGYGACKEFIERVLIKRLPAIIKTGSWQDAKTKLQETAQDKESHTPEYRVLEESGPDHDKRFVMGVYVNKELRGQGEGTSKQAAQQQAAEEALKHYER